MKDKLLRAFIEAQGFDIETIDSHQECIFSIDDTEKLNPIHLPVITDYKVTKKPFDILSDDYTDEVMRLHKTIQETNTYNEALYTETLRLKKKISALMK